MSYAMILVCGGLSTRMGCDKTFLPFGSTSLLQYQLNRFRPYFAKIILSVPKQADRPVDYKSLCGCDVIEDRISNIGPMGGLYSCLNSVSEDIIFFGAIDAPFTDPRLAQTLCLRLEADKQADAAVIRNPKGNMQPLFAAYRKSCLPALEKQISHENYKMRTCLESWNTVVEDVYLPSEQFFNMNDPESYYYALQKLAKIQPGQFPPSFTPETEKPRIPVISFTARSGTGKTSYLEKLIPLLKEQHIRLAILKHDAHGFEMDKPGKDSYRFTHAGADHVILTSVDQTAAILSHPGQSQNMEDLLRRIENVDLIITEGYKLGNQKKIQILRKGYCEEPIGNTENTIAIVADFPYETELPLFDLNRPSEIVPFLLTIRG